MEAVCPSKTLVWFLTRRSTCTYSFPGDHQLSYIGHSLHSVSLFSDRHYCTEAVKFTDGPKDQLTTWVELNTGTCKEGYIFS